MKKLLLVLLVLIGCGSGGSSPDIGSPSVGTTTTTVVATLCPPGQVLVGNNCVTPNKENQLGNYKFVYDDGSNTHRITMDTKARSKSPENTELYDGYIVNSGAHFITCTGYWSPSKSINIFECPSIDGMAVMTWKFTVHPDNSLSGIFRWGDPNTDSSLHRSSTKYPSPSWDPVQDEGFEK
jgi:hypothetical protein